MSTLLSSLPFAIDDRMFRRSTRADALERQVYEMIDGLRMAVIYAGNKQQPGAVINATGNTRSWKSYEAVAEDIAAALRRIGVGHVSVLPEDMNLGTRLREENIEFAWLNSGGVQGHSSAAHGPAMLEMLGIPYVGHSPLAAATLDDKHAFKRQMTAIGVPTAPFMAWHAAQGPLDLSRSTQFRRVFADWNGSFVVKPVNGRASLNVHHVEYADDLPAFVQAISEATNNQVLIEGYLGGREFCAAVCGPVTAVGGRLRRQADPFVFACIERVLETNERIFTSMDVKPITAERIKHLDRVGDARIVGELERIAHALYTEMELETLVRLDLRADDEGRLFVLEANPKPDLKARQGRTTSIIGESLDEFGMSYDDLILSLLADRIDTLFRRRRGSLAHVLPRADAPL